MLIPALFYTYNGAIGKSPDWVNITIFFVAAAIVYFVEWRLFRRENGGTCRFAWAAFAVLCVLAVLFAVFTFFTPTLPLFRDPQTGTYGI